MKVALALIVFGALNILVGSPPLLALDPSLDTSQYGHTAWTPREGFSVGATFAMAQTPDGYLWLASEFGLYRFDGVHAVAWQPPSGQQLPEKPYALLVSRDGTLWIGTFAGLASWNGHQLILHPEIGKYFVTSLLEDREGTVWAGILGPASDRPTGQLCAIRSGRPQCYLQDGAFGAFVWSLAEDSSGTLWAGAETGVWRWRPGAPRRYAAPGMRVGDLVTSGDGRILIGMNGAGLKRLSADKLESWPVHSPMNRKMLLPDHEVDSNKLLRDRDGGLWIGTQKRGLIHIHNGRTDVFTKSDGLSGDISCSLFEDREGNIWFASSRGLDRFRQLPVTTISAKQGLSSDYASSLIAGTDGSIWVASHDGLTRWMHGETETFRKPNGLPDDYVQCLFEDNRGRVWASFFGHGLSYFEDGRFVGVPDQPSEEVYSIAGDISDNLWLSRSKGLYHMRGGRLIEMFPWSAMGRHQQAKVVVTDQGGVWLAFWVDGGVVYFRDGRVRASYTAASGLGKGSVAGLRLDREGAVWAATQEGGLSRIKDAHVATLTTKDGLPCDTIHYSIEDDDRSLWLYTACGLVRIARSELDGWIADPKRSVRTTAWDAADGVNVRAVSPAYYNPPVAKSSDGKLWFQTGEGIQVVDPRHVALNKLPPPVYITQITADRQLRWRKLWGAASNLALPALVRDLQIDYTALSLVAPEKNQFKYRLEGYDGNWQDAGNRRQAFYTNLPPREYRFRVIASNNSGIWNETGDTVEFSVAPTYYQTAWFYASCVAAFVAMLWGLYRLRLYQIRREFNAQLEGRVDERMRVARELHDTMLQSFQAALIGMQVARNMFDRRPEKAVASLDEAISTAAGAVAEGRTAIQDLRAQPAGRGDLPQLLQAAGQELAHPKEAPDNASDNAPVFHVTVEGERQELEPLLQDEIYRIGQELLRNAFRHAHARRIEVEIRYEGRQLRLHVRDDGKGIEPEILQAGGLSAHFGLRGMRERVDRFGGKLEFWSESGAGTEARLTVRAGAAYANSNGGAFSFLRRKKA